jgi:hypothetical protein
VNRHDDATLTPIELPVCFATLSRRIGSATVKDQRHDAVKPDQRPRLRKNSTYVLPQWKLVYVSNPKAACTSIKWMLADLQGMDENLIYATLRQETTRSTTIHQHRSLWYPSTPLLRDLSPDELAEVTPENGWFVFSMTRHPSIRLWSAWQSKLLLREPRYMSAYAGEPWMPRPPESTDMVLEDWERFVRAVEATPNMPIMVDQHFRAQSVVLSVGRTPYDRLYETSEFATMCADVRAHLERQGWTGELSNRRSNETPLPPLERAFPAHVQATIAKVFKADFKKLGYDSPLPRKLRTDDYSADLLAAASMIAERADRIRDLSAQAMGLKQELIRARRPRSMRAQLRPAVSRWGRRTLHLRAKPRR